MKTNVTLKLDADLLREARVVAAEEGRSISALLRDRLEAMVRERKAFDNARRRALARLREGMDLQWTPPQVARRAPSAISTSLTPTPDMELAASALLMKEPFAFFVG